MATRSAHELSLWTDGQTRDTLADFLDSSDAIAPVDRVAVFDNDGTLWCERPAYAQKSFVDWVLHERISLDAAYEPPALLGEMGGASIGSASADDVATAMNSLFEGLTPDEFTGLVRRFASTWRHPRFETAVAGLRYTPMLQLLAALRRRQFDIFVVTGGGADFVRSLASDLYGVSPDRVVGSLVDYHFDPNDARLTRGVHLVGPPNEGPEKVSRIQTMLGRRPVFAAGNSAGDGEMLKYAHAAAAPNLALLVDHDDDVREYRYNSVAASFDDGADIVEVARAGGWVVASMQHDWAEVFDPG